MTVEEKAKQIVADRQRCKTDKFFLSQILGYDFQPDVHTELFANYLQISPGVSLFEQDSIKNRMALWSRGHYKTTSAVVEMVQLILNFPDIRILLMQGTVKNTRGLLKEVKSHFLGEAYGSRLRELFPEYCADKLGTADQFTTPARIRKNLKESTITVASPKTVKAGQHYDAGFFDDLVNEQNYQNPDLVQRAIDDFNHYTPLIDPGGYKYVTGTRYVFGDLYEWIIEKNKETKEWAITIKQCWYKDEHGKLKVTFPERKLPDDRLIGFTLEKLLKIQMADPQTFSAQYLNVPISSVKQLFTPDLIASHIKLANDPEIPNGSPSVLIIDLASSKHEGMDHTVVMAGKADRFGRVYVIDLMGGQYSPMETVEVIITMALRHYPYKILIEHTASATYFMTLLQTIIGARNIVLPLDFIKVNNQKDAKHTRISGLEGVLKSDRLFFLAGLPNWERMHKEFVEYKSRHDDYPDTVALMVEYFNTHVPQYAVPRLVDHPMFRPAAPTPIIKQIDTPRGETMGSDFCCD